jgi:hypothetical protein
VKVIAPDVIEEKHASEEMLLGLGGARDPVELSRAARPGSRYRCS